MLHKLDTYFSICSFPVLFSDRIVPCFPENPNGAFRTPLKRSDGTCDHSLRGRDFRVISLFPHISRCQCRQVEPDLTLGGQRIVFSVTDMALH